MPTKILGRVSSKMMKQTKIYSSKKTRFIIRELKQHDDEDDDGDNENGKKSMVYFIKTTTLHVHHAFLFIS